MLVSEMSLLDAKAILSRTREYGAIDNTELGTMYDLFRDDDDRNNVHICREFSVANLRQEWKWFSAQYVGRTDMTADAIKTEGTYLSLGWRSMLMDSSQNSQSTTGLSSFRKQLPKFRQVSARNRLSRSIHPRYNSMHTEETAGLLGDNNDR